MDTTILAALIGAVATIIAALVGRDFIRSKRHRPEQKLVKQFRRYIYSLKEIPSKEYQELKNESLRDGINLEGVIDESQKVRIMNWLKSIDDEILHVSKSLVIMKSKSRGLHGVTRSTLIDCSHPLGEGRSVEKLSDALVESGILAPSTETPPPGTYEARDADVNPSYDFGKMLFIVRPLLEQWELE